MEDGESALDARERPCHTCVRFLAVGPVMSEVQKHGFSFEQWVRCTLFGGYEGSYMQKWDVPARDNISAELPASLRGIPVSIKTVKNGSTINLGDVLRQRSISEPFLMITGFWTQRTPAEKWFERIGAAKFRAEDWSSLWGPRTLEHLRELDAIVKDMAANHEAVRQKAKDWKKRVADDSGSLIVINPKIDSKTQRRVQCSLPADVFWHFVGEAPAPSDYPRLFGFPFDNPLRSAPRTFNRD